MGTIEQQLEDILYDHDLGDSINTQLAAIIEPWNAALNELRIIRYIAQDDNDGECEMTVAITWAQQARIEAAIKAMKGTLLRDEESFRAVLAEIEGNSPSRDEAMVKDERYERDDIYKK